MMGNEGTTKCSKQIFFTTYLIFCCFFFPLYHWPDICSARILKHGANDCWCSIVHPGFIQLAVRTTAASVNGVNIGGQCTGQQPKTEAISASARNQPAPFTIHV